MTSLQWQKICAWPIPVVSRTNDVWRDHGSRGMAAILLHFKPPNILGTDSIYNIYLANFPTFSYTKQVDNTLWLSVQLKIHRGHHNLVRQPMGHIFALTTVHTGYHWQTTVKCYLFVNFMLWKNFTYWCTDYMLPFLCIQGCRKLLRARGAIG
jgi:hypothetical protein